MYGHTHTHIMGVQRVHENVICLHTTFMCVLVIFRTIQLSISFLQCARPTTSKRHLTNNCLETTKKGITYESRGKKRTRAKCEQRQSINRAAQHCSEKTRKHLARFQSRIHSNNTIYLILAIFNSNIKSQFRTEYTIDLQLKWKRKNNTHIAIRFEITEICLHQQNAAWNFFPFVFISFIAIFAHM